MSKGNVETVRRVIDAFNRSDPEAVFEDLAPNYEHDLSRAVGPWRGVYGVDQLPKLFADLAELWESNRYEAEEFIEAGEQVVTPFTNHLRGRDGIEVQARGAFLWTIRDGRLTRLCFYQGRNEALEAAGLSE
jgi:ketosteroid isomerase-like protein